MYLNELLVLVVKLVTLSSEALYNTSFPYVSTENQKIIIELLLDIRNILTKKEKEEE